MRSQSGLSDRCPGCAEVITRRKALQLVSNGFGYVAFSAMAAADTPAVRLGQVKPHFAPKS